MEKISVMIPLYNGIEYLEECINSVKAQTYKEWEIIVGVNGHKIDSDIYKQAKSYDDGQQIHVILYKTKGKPNTMNAMLKDCNYDIICLLDADDYWAPTKLEQQIKYIKNYDVIGTQAYYIRSGIKAESPKIPLGNINDFLTCNPMINSSLMLKRKDAKWEDVILDDYELILRLASESKKFYNISQPLTMHRIHNKSFFNSKGNHLHLKNVLKKWTNKIKQ